MYEFAYFDLFDSENAARFRPEEEGKEVRECAVQQAMLATLRGWTPVFSQGQAIDSVSLLSILLDSSEREPFVWLIREGFIKVLLWSGDDQRTLVDRAIRDFQEEDPLFAVWIELNRGQDESRPQVAKEELIEALRTGQAKSTLGDALNGFVAALRELSSVIENAKPTVQENIQGKRFQEASRGTMFTDTLKDFKTSEDDMDVATALGSLLALQSGRRTILMRTLRRMENLSIDAQARTENLLNIALNNTTARCVHSVKRGLNATAGTTLSRQSAVRTAGRALSGAQPSNISRWKRGVLCQGITQCSWGKVREFVEKRRNLDAAQWQRDLFASELVARCATEEGTELGILIRNLSKAPSELVDQGVGALAKIYGVDEQFRLIYGGVAGNLFDFVLPEEELQSRIRTFTDTKLKDVVYGLLRNNPDDLLP